MIDGSGVGLSVGVGSAVVDGFAVGLSGDGESDGLVVGSAGEAEGFGSNPVGDAVGSGDGGGSDFDGHGVGAGFFELERWQFVGAGL